MQGKSLRISHWVGRLGNVLIQLSNAVFVAEQTRSILRIPPHELLRKTTYDFREEKSTDGEYSSPFFWPHECLDHPITRDSVRRQVFRKHVLPELLYSSFGQRLSQWMRGSDWENETLLINIRSGEDIFRKEPPPQSDYMQPPMAFYQKIIEDHGYKKCVIVTEKPPNLNPVIPALLKWNSQISLHTHKSILSDVQLILKTSHLVMAHSTFTWCLALMSDRLKILHQPSTFQVRGVKDFRVLTYGLPGYIAPGTWTCSDSQLREMLEYPMRNITVRDGDEENASLESSFGVTMDAEQLSAIRKSKGEL
jgi:hypothetical protein